MIRYYVGSVHHQLSQTINIHNIQSWEELLSTMSGNNYNLGRPTAIAPNLQQNVINNPLKDRE